MKQLLADLPPEIAAIVNKLNEWKVLEEDVKTLKISQFAQDSRSLLRAIDSYFNPLNKLRKELTRAAVSEEAKEPQNASEYYAHYLKLASWFERLSLPAPALAALDRAAKEYILYFVGERSPRLIEGVERIFAGHRELALDAFAQTFTHRGGSYKSLIYALCAAIHKLDKKFDKKCKSMQDAELIYSNLSYHSKIDFVKTISDISALGALPNHYYVEFHVYQRLKNILFDAFKNKIDSMDVKTLTDAVLALIKSREDNKQNKIRKLIYLQIQVICIRRDLSPRKKIDANEFPGDDLRDFMQELDVLRAVNSVKAVEYDVETVIRLQARFKNILAHNEKILEDFKQNHSYATIDNLN